jgi:hypothetical protein
MQQASFRLLQPNRTLADVRNERLLHMSPLQQSGCSARRSLPEPISALEFAVRSELHEYVPHRLHQHHIWLMQVHIGANPVRLA